MQTSHRTSYRLCLLLRRFLIFLDPQSHLVKVTRCYYRQNTTFLGLAMLFRPVFVDLNYKQVLLSPLAEISILPKSKVDKLSIFLMYLDKLSLQMKVNRTTRPLRLIRVWQTSVHLKCEPQTLSSTRSLQRK